MEICRGDIGRYRADLVALQLEDGRGGLAVLEVAVTQLAALACEM